MISRDILRAKAVEEELSPAEISRHLGVEEAEVHRLLHFHRRHLTFARATRQLGRALANFYQGTAINVTLNLLAVLLGFGLASSWQAREENLREMRSFLSVLKPLQEEVTTLAGHARELHRATPCKIGGFDVSLWQSIATSERALVLEDLYSKVRGAYAEVSGAVAVAEMLDETGCKGLLGKLRTTLESLERTMRERIAGVEADYDALKRRQASGLVAFIGTTIGWFAVIVLGLPAVSYIVLHLTTRAVR